MQNKIIDNTDHIMYKKSTGGDSAVLPCRQWDKSPALLSPVTLFYRERFSRETHVFPLHRSLSLCDRSPLRIHAIACLDLAFNKLLRPGSFVPLAQKSGSWSLFQKKQLTTGVFKTSCKLPTCSSGLVPLFLRLASEIKVFARRHQSWRTPPATVARSSNTIALTVGRLKG